MRGTLLAFLGKYTVLSISLGLLACVIDKLSFNLKNEITVELIEENWIAFIITLGLLIAYVLIYSAMLEHYEFILQTIFKKPMLEYTLAKKKFKNGCYEVEGNPRKSYDKLPQTIKTDIDKLDNLIYQEKVPKLIDLSLASFNSLILLLYGFFIKSDLYLTTGVFASFYFGFFGINAYSDLKKVIIYDYKSLFED
ncbi:hypothetical protein [Methanosarcina mazei]|jgi:hypothetical protein|nr:hypothetical protein [Methanosarcina mazei]AKB69502.1 hypothetical protein MSMAL_2959 [Methanosarcina mazei LYC]KKG89461.1 hypothetical protein DU69_13080 [Methanosarcina mazei]MDY0143825.1 hypothetical protein [Bacteroidales bacterium]